MAVVEPGGGPFALADHVEGQAMEVDAGKVVRRGQIRLRGDEKWEESGMCCGVVLEIFGGWLGQIVGWRGRVGGK